jgi:hypothetical protein
MASTNGSADILYRLIDIPIHNVAEHTALSNHRRVLATNKSDHPANHIFRRVGTKLSIFDNIQTLALQTEVNILPRHRRRKSNIQPALIFSFRGIKLNHLSVYSEWQIAAASILTQ